MDIAENKCECECLNRRDERNDFFVKKPLKLGLVERNLRIWCKYEMTETWRLVALLTIKVEVVRV
jgi:hypothetical protein